MRYFAMILGFLAATLIVLPGLTAQEKDKKGDKADKTEKAEKKEGDEKKDKEKKPIEEKPEHGQVIKTKILSMRPDSARDFTIELPMLDPQKMWQLQQSLAQARNPAEYQQRMAQANVFTMKPVDVRAVDGCKVRTMFPPIQYDDAGNLKKWSKKELEAMKKNSKLPGFPAEFDAIKTGQWVELYLAKTPKDKGGTKAGPKEKPPPRAKDKKKKREADDPLPEPRPDVVMIVFWAEPMGR